MLSSMGDVNIIYRPISKWVGERSSARAQSPFKSSPRDHWVNTRSVLARELEHLGADDVLLEMGLKQSEISTVTGMPKNNARQPDDPGVIISFDSRHGPLRYATDRFEDWRDNVRAIALGLESLRRVDRYGITNRGEQYSGWLQIEAASASDEEARRYLCELTGLAFDAKHDDATLVRWGRKITHPDTRGPGITDEDWDRVSNAANTLGLA